MANLSKPGLETTYAEESKSVHREHTTLLHRVGWQAASSLFVTVLAILAVVGFVTFLWFANMENTTWHRIMVEGWATRAVSISTLVLRLAIDVQAGIAAAMLAAVVIESSSVLLHAAAKVSTMRATNPQPRTLLELIPAMLGSRGTLGGLDCLGYSVVVLLLFTTSLALQFSSTVLLSDLSLGQLSSLPLQRDSTYDFDYGSSDGMHMVAPGLGLGKSGMISYPIQYRTPTWSRNPPSYPAFAEYSAEVPPVEGVDDTGVLLRAFLPFADAQSRETIRDYSGHAMVLDSRVRCINET